jgi:hypothetical protein
VIIPVLKLFHDRHSQALKAWQYIEQTVLIKMHIAFGMVSHWRYCDPSPTFTNRLRLYHQRKTFGPGLSAIALQCANVTKAKLDRKVR